ncbi:restriction endonuclease [Planctomycetota bacterium]
MAIIAISQEEFDSHNPARNDLVKMLTTEKAWFSDSARNIIGASILDHTDRDWSYVILAQHEDGQYRCIELDTSLSSQAVAERALQSKMSEMEQSDKASETLFEDKSDTCETKDTSIALTDITSELKRYFHQHPERLYDLSPRKFEELIASILEDLGFDVHLTQATRDGGTDIIAYIRNAVCEFLTLVECKKYAADRKVGVGIIREVTGVHHLKRATKSLVVTTSFFTKNAIEEAKAIEHQIDLKNYEDIKQWLKEY